MLKAKTPRIFKMRTKDNLNIDQTIKNDIIDNDINSNILQIDTNNGNQDKADDLNISKVTNPDLGPNNNDNNRDESISEIPDVEKVNPMQAIISNLLQKISRDKDSLNKLNFSQSKKYLDYLKLHEDNINLISKTVNLNNSNVSLKDFSSYIDQEVNSKLDILYKNLIKDFNDETNSGLLSDCLGNKNTLLSKLALETSNSDSQIKFYQICGIFDFIVNIDSIDRKIQFFDGDLNIVKSSLEASGIFGLEGEIFQQAFIKADLNLAITSRAENSIKTMQNKLDPETNMKLTLQRLIENIKSDIKTIEESGIVKAQEYMKELKNLEDKLGDFLKTLILTKFNIKPDDFDKFIEENINQLVAGIYEKVIILFNSSINNPILSKLVGIISENGKLLKLDKICGSLKFITNKDALSSLVKDLDSDDINFIIKSLKDSGVWDLTPDVFAKVFSSKSNLESNKENQELPDQKDTISTIIDNLLDKVSLDTEIISRSNLSQSSEYIEKLNNLSGQILLIKTILALSNPNISSNDLNSYLDQTIGSNLSDLYKNMLKDFNSEKNSGFFSYCSGSQNEILKKLSQETSNENSNIKFDKICGALEFVTQTNGINNSLVNLTQSQIKNIAESITDSGLWNISSDSLTSLFSGIGNGGSSILGIIQSIILTETITETVIENNDDNLRKIIGEDEETENYV